MSGHNACINVNPPATGGDDLWNFFNLFYYTGFPADGDTSHVYGITESGQYIPKISQLDIAQDFKESGVCPSAVPIDTHEYNYQPPHSSVMLSSGKFESPTGLFGILETNSKHSCLQDLSECGGGLWCNKIFFPRRSYKASKSYVTPGYLMEPPYSVDAGDSYIKGDGTRIAPFGSTAICLANADWTWDKRYDGWGTPDFRPWNTTSHYSEPDYIQYEILGRFWDVCDDKVVTEVFPYDVGIDDSRVSVRDYLPLIGVIHPGFKMTIDTKSCVVLGTGCDRHFMLPTHSDQSISVGLFAPKTWSANQFDAMGYSLDKDGDGAFATTGGLDPPYLPYRNSGRDVTQGGQPILPLQKVGASGVDECLFSPFKILVDVECSTNRIKRAGVATDEPTQLNFVTEMPGVSCSGLQQIPKCGCSETNCNENYPPFMTTGELVYELGNEYSIEDANFESGCEPFTGDEKLIVEGQDVSSTVILGRCVEVVANGGTWLGEGDVRGIGISGTCDGVDGIKESIPFSGMLDTRSTGIWVALKQGTGCTSESYTNVYEVVQSIQTAMWDCENYLYVRDAKNFVSTDPCTRSNGLCGVRYRLPLPVNCSECTILNSNTGIFGVTNIEDRGLGGPGFTGAYNEHPNTGWWQADCGCEFTRQAEYQCSNSIVKMTITE